MHKRLTTVGMALATLASGATMVAFVGNGTSADTTAAAYTPGPTYTTPAKSGGMVDGTGPMKEPGSAGPSHEVTACPDASQMASNEECVPGLKDGKAWMIEPGGTKIWIMTMGDGQIRRVPNAPALPVR